MSTDGRTEHVTVWVRRLPRSILVLGATLLVMATLPFWFGSVGGYLSLATTMLIWMLFAVGYDIELGYTGMLSMGHTIMFGIGGYGTAILLEYALDDAILAVVLGTLLATVIAFVVGRLSHRTKGLFFTLTTLAFSMMFYFGSQQLEFTGGHDGLAGLPPLVADPLVEYYVLFAVVVVGSAIAYWIVQSPYGVVLRGVRDNDRRLRHLGYDATSYQVSAFVVSGVYAGLAGSFLAVTSGFIGPEVFFWTTAFQIVIYTIIGGIGTLVGPMMAAAGLIALEGIAGSLVAHWDPVLGTVLILIVVFSPGGLYALVSEPGGAE